MAENETEKPVPNEPEGAPTEGIEAPTENLLVDENEVTIILPDDEDEDGMEIDSEVTETVPLPDDAGSGDVFVLLPDGDDADIPMVETEEVDAGEEIHITGAIDVTEEMDSPPLQSAFDSATATQVGLRVDNPLTAEDLGDTERLMGEEPTEDCLIAEEPTDPIGPDDLEDLASEVADDLITADSAAPAAGAAYGEGDYDDGGDLDAMLEDEYSVQRRSRSGFGKVLLTLAAMLVVAAVGGWFAFPEYYRELASRVGVELPGGSTPVAVVTPDPVNPTSPVQPDPGDPPVGGGTGTPDVTDVPDAELALVARREFRTRVLSAIELGFTGEVTR